MRFIGLKTSIAGTLLMLLGVALVIGNLVTVVFWQKSLVRSEIIKAQAIIKITEKLLEEKKLSGRSILVDDFGQLVDDLRGLADEMEKSSLSIIYYDGKKMIRYPADAQNIISEQIVRNSALTQQEIINLKGARWALLSFGSNSLIVARPLLGTSQKHSALGVQIELLSVYQVIKDNLKIVFVYLLVNTIILSVIGLFRMFSLVVKPIERLVAVSESYQISDKLAFPIREVGNEFSQLSMALSSMLLRIDLDREQLKKTVVSLEGANKELVQTQKEMVEAEKLAAVGRLSAGLAHEIGNPLGIIQGYVELLQQSDVPIEDRHQFAQRALGELERINRLIRQLLDFARATPKAFEMFSLNDVLDELQEMFAAQHYRPKITLLVEVDDVERLEGDRDGIKQVLLNCLLNAADSISLCHHDENGNVKIKVSNKIMKDGEETVCIKVEDTGAGVKAHQQDLLFEPFYSTKDSGKGTGLGLSVSRSIIEKHGGRMWIEGEDGQGAVVIIEIPKKQTIEA